MILTHPYIGHAEEYKNIKLSQNDRILILAPHPDDESIGCAGIIQHAVEKNIPVHILFLTYGDSNQWSFAVYRKHPVLMPKAVLRMGLIRHDEAIAAAKVLDIPADHLTFLGYPDFKTLDIWYSHWADSPPAKGMLTDAESVPYKNAFRPGAPYKGEDILKDLKTVLRKFKPTKIFLSHPADHHPDHRSLYLYAKVALWDLEKEINPDLYPYMVHFKKWPQPRGLHPEIELKPVACLKERISWEKNELDQKEITIKENAIKKHRSQYKYSSEYLLSFIRPDELFGDYTAINLQQNASSISLESKDKEYFSEYSDQLTDKERESFVGLVEQFVSIENNNLLISLTLSRPLVKEVELSVHIFGYSDNIPFESMPKIHVHFDEKRFKVYDQKKRLPDDNIKVTRRGKEIQISIPIKVFRNPIRILTGTRTYLEEIPLDWAAWRILELS